jgi:hypothetical protein
MVRIAHIICNHLLYGVWGPTTFKMRHFIQYIAIFNNQNELGMFVTLCKLWNYSDKSLCVSCFHSCYELGPLPCSDPELASESRNMFRKFGRILWTGVGLSQGLYLYRTQHRKSRTYPCLFERGSNPRFEKNLCCVVANYSGDPGRGLGFRLQTVFVAESLVSVIS